MLRHGSATENAKFLTDSELKVRHGWTMGSRMASVYVHLSGKDLDDKLVGIYSGKQVKPQTPEFSPVICPRCKEKSSPGIQFCGKCGTPLDQAANARSRSEMEEIRSELQSLKELLKKSLESASLHTPST